MTLLGVERVVGPRVEWRAGRLTDRTLHPLVIGERKASVTRQALREWEVE